MEMPGLFYKVFNAAIILPPVLVSQPVPRAGSIRALAVHREPVLALALLQGPLPVFALPPSCNRSFQMTVLQPSASKE
jgi:hypothetical protein